MKKVKLIFNYLLVILFVNYVSFLLPASFNATVDWMIYDVQNHLSLFLFSLLIYNITPFSDLKTKIVSFLATCSFFAFFLDYILITIFLDSQYIVLIRAVSFGIITTLFISFISLAIFRSYE